MRLKLVAPSHRNAGLSHMPAVVGLRKNFTTKDTKDTKKNHEEKLLARQRRAEKSLCRFASFVVDLFSPWRRARYSGTAPKSYATALHRHDPKARIDAELADLRYRGLLSGEDWQSLPPAVRRRFSHRCPPGQGVVYVGEIVETKLNPAGWVFAQIARLIGAPLPTSVKCSGRSVVSVVEDARSGGQIWSRLHMRSGHFPQVIHSSKLFSGPTGLEEYVGRGIGMALHVCASDSALQFCSAGYFFRIGGMRIPIPTLCTPGNLTVTHADIGHGRFVFTLDVVHPLFGRIIRQSATYMEARP